MKLNQFIKGMGSLLTIYPVLEYSSATSSKQALDQRIQKTWRRVALAFEKTLNEIDACDKK